VASGNNISFTVDDISKFIDSSALAVRIKSGDRVSYYPIDSVSSTVVIDAQARNLVDGSRTLWADVQGLGDELASYMGASPDRLEIVPDKTELRLVAPLGFGMSSSDPYEIALRLLLSEYGDGTRSANYDTIPGTAPAEESTGIRFGANKDGVISVDATSFESCQRENPISVCQGFMVEEEQSILDVLTSEILPVVGGYLYTNASGQLAIAPHRAVVLTDTLAATIDSSLVVGRASTYEDESQIPSTIKFEFAYDWPSKKFTEAHIANIMALDRIYDDKKTVEVTSRLFAPEYLRIKSMITERISSTYDGQRVVKLTGQWPLSTLKAGDVVKISSLVLPNFEGASSITNEYYVVTSIKHDEARKTVALELLRRLSGKLIAPAAFVTGKVDTRVCSWSATNSAVTTVTGSLADAFAVGWKIKFLDVANDAFRVGGGSSVGVLSVVGATQMTFTGGPNDVATGDVVLLADYASADNATDNANGADQRDYAYLSDASVPPVIVAGVTSHKWI
jgi:hypothetical protein